MTGNYTIAVSEDGKTTTVKYTETGHRREAGQGFRGVRQAVTAGHRTRITAKKPRVFEMLKLPSSILVGKMITTRRTTTKYVTLRTKRSSQDFSAITTQGLTGHSKK